MRRGYNESPMPLPNLPFQPYVNLDVLTSISLRPAGATTTKEENHMKPVVYIELPEAPLAFIGESPNYFAVNLCCLGAVLFHIPPGQLPQYAQSMPDLHEALIILRLRREA